MLFRRQFYFIWIYFMQIIFKKPLGKGSALSTCHFPDTILGKICEHYWTIFTQDKSIKTWKIIIFQYLSEHRWRNKKSERSKEKRRNLAQGNYLHKLLSLILELCNSRPKLVKQSSISKIHHQPDISENLNMIFTLGSKGPSF